MYLGVIKEEVRNFPQLILVGTFEEFGSWVT